MTTPAGLPRLAAVALLLQPSAGLLLQPHAATRLRVVARPVPRALTPPGMVVPIPPLVAACTLPTCLGFWKSEYGVSYAYGAAMLSCGLLNLPHSLSALGTAHCLALVAYGARLIGFLLFRELFIPRFREMRERIEARAVERGGRLKRLPFIVSCSLLYFCMAAPLRLTTQLPAAALPGGVRALLWAAVAVAYAGFAVAAAGDLCKTVHKARNGEDSLVTTGLFRLLRHPNYTGEFVGWSASAAAAALCLIGAPSVVSVAWAAASAGGAFGIGFVLAMAATGLERRQRDKYGDQPEYEAWCEGTWAGPVLSP